jgi:hypothetical protein
VRVAVVAAACVAAGGIAEARPARGPVARAERRVFRAQMALERELARPVGRVQVIQVPVFPAQPGGIPNSIPNSIPGAIPGAIPGGIPAAAAAPAATGVAPAAFEAAAPPRSPAGPSPASAATPAADGTVSVLVHSEASAAGAQPAQEPAPEPLLLPRPSQP